MRGGKKGGREEGGRRDGKGEEEVGKKREVRLMDTTGVMHAPPSCQSL